jgi:hypothetical protein
MERALQELNAKVYPMIVKEEELNTFLDENIESGCI